MVLLVPFISHHLVFLVNVGPGFTKQSHALDVSTSRCETQRGGAILQSHTIEGTSTSMKSVKGTEHG